MGGRVIDATVARALVHGWPRRAIQAGSRFQWNRSTRTGVVQGLRAQGLIDNPEPGTFVLWGHGELEAAALMDESSLQDIAEAEGMVMAATDWHERQRSPFLAGA